MTFCDYVGKNNVLPISKTVINLGKVLCVCETKLYQT